MILECGLIGLVGYGCYLYKTMDKRGLINNFNFSFLFIINYLHLLRFIFNVIVQPIGTYVKY